jgi:hypothetical protein
LPLLTLSPDHLQVDVLRTQPLIKKRPKRLKKLVTEVDEPQLGRGPRTEAAVRHQGLLEHMPRHGNIVLVRRGDGVHSSHRHGPHVVDGQTGVVAQHDVPFAVSRRGPTQQARIAGHGVATRWRHSHLPAP